MTDAAFLAEVEKFLSSWDLPALCVDSDGIIESSPALKSSTTTSKLELERMKDRKRRRAYRARRQVERESLKQEVEKLADELFRAKNLHESPWKMVAERQLAARQSSEALQRQLFKAIKAQTTVVEDFYRLMYDQLSNVAPLEEQVDSTSHYQPKRIRVEPFDAEIFAAYALELGLVYAQTEDILRSKGLSADANWNAPIEIWDEDSSTSFFRFRGKITIPCTFRKLCKYRWQAAHLFHRQENRELYDGMEDPKNTLALQYRVTTRLNSGQVGTALQRIVIRRYQEDDRMVLVWRLFTEGEGFFTGMHSDETGWSVATPTPEGVGTVIRTCVHNVPVLFSNLSTREPIVRQFNCKLMEWGLENNETVTTGLVKQLVK